MSKRVVKGIYHFSWYLVAAIIFAAVVSATAIRLVLTDIDGYRDEIQTWVSEYMEYPVVFNEIDIEWRGWTPHFALSDIKLLDPDGQHTISHFDNVRVGINLVKSLRAWALIPDRLIISGLRLDLTRTKDGAITILGDEPMRPYDQDTARASELSAWLLGQTDINLQNAKISWTDQKLGKATMNFIDVGFRLRRYRERTQIDASAGFPDGNDDLLELKLDINGNLTTPNWSGQIYLQAGNLSPDQFLPIADLKIDHTRSNFRIWTDWEQARLSKVKGYIDYQDLNMAKDGRLLSIPKLKAAVSAKREDTRNWTININTEPFSTANGSWPKAEHAIQLRHDEQNNTYDYSAWFEYLNAQDATVLLRAFAAENRFINDLLNDYGINGALNDFKLSHSHDKEHAGLVDYSFKFSKLNIIERDTDASISGLSGALTGDNETISVNLDSEIATLAVPDHLHQPVQFSSITGNLNWENPGSVNKLEIPLMTLNTPNFPLSLSGRVDFSPNQGSPFVDMIMSVGRVDLAKVSDYMPVSTPAWLTRAFVAGNITSSNLLFRGSLRDYPFIKSDGIFQAVFNIENATLDYHKDWPPLDNLDAEVIINDQHLDVLVTNGNIYDARIKHINASIDDFISDDDPRLLIEGALAGELNHARLFIEQSPLANKISLDDVADRDLVGRTMLAIKLNIPMEGGLITVAGDMKLIDAGVVLESTGFGLQKINGTVNFTEKLVTAGNIDAIYRLHPVTVGINGRYGSPFEVTLAGTADNEFISQRLREFYPALIAAMPDLQDSMRGRCEWTLKAHKTDNGIVANLSSDMHGLGLDLPAPLGKTRAEIRPTLLSATIRKSIIDHMRIEHGSVLQAELDFNAADSARSGPASAQRAPRKVLIKGDIDSLDLSKWAQYAGDGGSSASFNEYEGEIAISKLLILGNEFNDIGLSFAATDGGYQTNIRGADIQGKIFLPDSSPPQPITADIEHLILKKNKPVDGDKNQVLPESIPAFDLRLNKVSYDNIDLGEVNIVTGKIEQGMEIKTISFTKPDISINGKGTWHKDTDTNLSLSVFNFDIYAKNLADMLNGYGYSGSDIEGAETFINFDTSWDGAPTDFSFNKINGTMSLAIGEGSLLDINPVAGRLLGLFNFQTLYRRLSLDFSDIFGKGLNFDDVKGNFELGHGNAYTNDLRMQGPSVEILVTGRTGISARDYDQSAIVTPKISYTLPVFGAVLAPAGLGPIGAGVGVAIFLAGKLFDGIPTQVDKLLSYRYTITGSWDEPVIERVSVQK